MKKLNSKTIKILAVACFSIVAIVVGYFVVRASPDSVGDDFDFPPTKIDSFRPGLTICGGEVKLGEETFTGITECNCNSLEGWYWYDVNNRPACWSKTLADSVSWNKGLGHNTKEPGAYTCATSTTALKDRMVAVAAGEWYKIVSSVAGVSITSADNGSAGWSKISALAIADCIDGVRDLCDGTDCLGTDATTITTNLGTWAAATGGKSALPYCTGTGCSPSTGSDFRAVCELTPHFDLPLWCEETNIFYKNQKVCRDGDTNYTWAAAVGSATIARPLGGVSCSSVSDFGSGNTSGTLGFRAVVRP